MKQISAKQIGKNFLVIIEGNKFIKVLSTDEDKQKLIGIKNKILLYNKKNSKELLDEIENFVNTKKVEIEKKISEKKGAKKVAKKASKKKETKKVTQSTSDLIKQLKNTKLTSEQEGELKLLLQNNNVVTESVKPVVTQNTRRGEY